MRELSSGPGMWKDFFESTIWKDIKAELEELREIARDGMEDAEDDRIRISCSYRARTIREILFMIENFGKEIKEKEIEDEDPNEYLDEPIDLEGDENA